MKKDLIVEEARQVREELVKKHGGLDGWIDHLQELDKAHSRRKKKRPVKSAEASKGSVRQRTSRRLPIGPA